MRDISQLTEGEKQIIRKLEKRGPLHIEDIVEETTLDYREAKQIVMSLHNREYLTVNPNLGFMLDVGETPTQRRV